VRAIIMARGNINTSGMVEDIYPIIQWLEYNVTKLDDSSKIMKKMLGELSSSEVFECSQSIRQLQKELDNLLYPCLDRIDHAKYIMEKSLSHYKKLEEIINTPGLLPF
jgi:hypothetical protein